MTTADIATSNEAKAVVENEPASSAAKQPVPVAEIASYVGYKAIPTDWHHVTQAQIDQFADCTLDHQFIHIDPEKAKNTPFGSTIAHGFLTLSLLSHFAEQFSITIEGAYMGINSGFDKIRFLQPVKVGSMIRAHATIESIDETKPGQYRVKTNVSVEIEGVDTPALIAEWIGIQLVK
ncbi:MaoC family dehydratase [Thalassotalea euphylliae]|uniref:MaoC family dehydratase n=1 Tax=Thalassotalea euphylliae TaxID=1655234 RepID=A0A3E0TYL3_9GAMM|nr:MaoC family dehydratase [Thalassotalea euphylliae]REL29554.1 MaoC family dehydratase [Thalassotalea euphylliae]